MIHCKPTRRLSEGVKFSIRRTDKQGLIRMKTLSLIIALVIFLTVGAVAPSLGEYWIVTDTRGTPSVADKYSTNSWASIRGPFKYYDEAVRDMGTGRTGGRPFCDFTGLCSPAKLF
jgi:hypothetical protein